MRPARNGRRRRVGASAARRGFTLIELAVALVILGLILIAVVTLVPMLTGRMRLDVTGIDLRDAREAVVGFASKNHRLPCPDTDGDGDEGAGNSCPDDVGTLPFRSLGLPGPVLDQARLPLRYGVYRNAAASADLTELENLFEPDLPGGLVIDRGTVDGCGQILTDAIQIIYANVSENVLTVTPISGTFAVDDYVSGSTLDYNNVVSNTPTYPACVCGVDPPPPANTCLPCTNFLAGEQVYLSGQTPSDAPNAEIDSITGSTLILPFPTGTFTAGDVIVGETSGVSATVTDFYYPGTAKILSIQTAGQVFGVDLIPTATVFFDPAQDFGFVPGQKLFSSGGDTATYVNLQPDQQNQFQVGETVVGLTSGASGTIDAISDTILTVSGVSGTFIAPPATPTVDENDPGNTTGTGETIQGTTSQADADIVAIRENVYAEPTVTYGTITIPDPNVTPSGELNQLDFCKSLRNGILASDAAAEVHTVNASSVIVTPAFLLVSGGIEDAVPGDTAFDGLNEGIATQDFESPARGRDGAYDDLVLATPMQVLDTHASCSRNLGAVNALAVDAFVAQNIAISSFNNHENALSAIEAGWAALKLAEANVAIEAFLVAIAAGECAKALTEAILTKGVCAIIGAGASCAAAVLQAVNFAFAIDALVKASDDYDASCTDQLGASSELTAAEAAFLVALERAEEADRKGGVE